MSETLQGGPKVKAEAAAPVGRAARRVLALGRDLSGLAAVEFAVIAPIFLTMTAALIEVSTMFFANAVMEGAAVDAARQVRTGLAQKSADPLKTFKDQLCESLYYGVDCAALVFDVRTFPDFASTDVTVPLDDEGNMADPTFSPGASGDIVVVRATYRWNFLTPLVGHLFSDNGTNSTLLVSTAVFRNEPYEND